MAKSTKEEHKNASANGAEPEAAAGLEENSSAVVTTLIAGVAVAVLAPELLPGMALGIAAVAAPKILPTLANIIAPLARTVVRAGYKTAVKTREMAAEATEQLQDIVAEVKAEERTAQV
jgi:hypothetical protein